MTLDEAIKHCEEKARELRCSLLKQRMADIEEDTDCLAVLDEGSEVSYKDVNGDHIPVVNGGFHFEYREKEKDNGKP